MKLVFTVLAWIVAIIAAIQLVIAVAWLWDLLWVASAVVGFVHAYAWILVGDLWEKVERLER